jgi:hypothetical protein
MQDLAGHIRRIIAGKKYTADGKFFRLARTPKRHVGTEGLNLFRWIVDGISGGQIGPGATPFTRIPFLASACDSERVNAAIAPLVEQ